MYASAADPGEDLEGRAPEHGSVLQGEVPHEVPERVQPLGGVVKQHHLSSNRLRSALSFFQPPFFVYISDSPFVSAFPYVFQNSFILSLVMPLLHIAPVLTLCLTTSRLTQAPMLQRQMVRIA